MDIYVRTFDELTKEGACLTGAAIKKEVSRGKKHTKDLVRASFWGNYLRHRKIVVGEERRLKKRGVTKKVCESRNFKKKGEAG